MNKPILLFLALLFAPTNLLVTFYLLLIIALIAVIEGNKERKV